MNKYNIDLCHRIRDLRNAIPMNQKDFGSKIEVAQSYLTNIETAKRPVTDKIFKLICLQSWNGKFVNENWLRTGEGNIFKDIPSEDEVSSAISNALDDVNCKNSIYTLVKEFLLKYEKLDSPSKKIVEEYIDDVLKNFCAKRGE